MNKSGVDDTCVTFNIPKYIFKEEMNTFVKTLFRFPSRTVVRRSLTLKCSEELYQKLPKLPVPKLEDTLNKFLKSVRPFLSNDEFAVTEKTVKSFGASGGIGEQLQTHLECRFEEKENWLEEWWLKTAYLGFRYPVVVHSSPGLVFPKREFKNEDEKLTYAARLITAAVDYKLKIDLGKIPLEKMGKHPLDMSQYYKIFGTCRIPKIPTDKLAFDRKSRHIVVIHNNRFFKMNVLCENGIQLSDEQIKKALKVIIDRSQEYGPPVGILTTLHRDKWSTAFEQLVRDDENENSLQNICNSLFTLSFDKCCYERKELLKCIPEFMTLAGIQLITGGGPQYNGGNRWYDKTIQFAIDSDGHNGLTYEHSPAEGQPIAVMMDHIVKYIDNYKKWEGPVTDDDSKPEELNFNLNQAVLSAIEEAKTDLHELNENLDVQCFKFKGYGKEFIKSQKLSPDSFIQMAIQYAFYRIHETPGAHYESAATRMFSGGRTETIRSCSVESIKFCTTMLNSSASNVEKAQSLRTAVNGHKDYTNQALQGLGIDRHLLGLKLVAIEKGLPIPDLYSDVGYVRSLHMRISTSQVASLCDGFMVYGPLVEDGYACCYNPRKNDINFGTSAFKSCSSTSARNWRDSIVDSLNDMKNVLEQAPQAKL